MKKASLVLAACIALFGACSGDSGSPVDPGGSNGGNGGGGGGGGGGGTSNVITVTVDGLSFSPANVTISPGQTVVWTKQDNGTRHTITPRGHSQWNSVESSGTGEMLRVTFNTAGQYEYFCQPHLASQMVGTVTVQ